MTDAIQTTEKEGVFTITLNRPERLNAIDLPALQALVAALDQARQRARVVVLAGNGRVFCAGADQAEMVPRSAAEWETIVDRYLDPIRRICSMPQPVIAKLHGDAIGGGLGLALASDYRLAVDSVRLSAPFVKIGLAGCDMSAGYFLPRLVGLGRATDIMMSGRFVGAEEAERIGLVTRVLPAAELDGSVAELADKLARGPREALAFTKRAIRRSLELTMDAEFDYEIFAQVQCLQSADHREGLAAFREKRAPQFGETQFGKE